MRWPGPTRLQMPPGSVDPWWIAKAEQLQALMSEHESAYVYDLDTARGAARRLASLDSVNRVFYAVKANDHVSILRVLSEEGLGFECVSMEEVKHVQSAVPGLRKQDILFTPNFAPREEYEAALQAGIRLTVDNSWAIHQWPEVFTNRKSSCGWTWIRAMGITRKSLRLGRIQSSGFLLTISNNACRPWTRMAGKSSDCMRIPAAGSTTRKSGRSSCDVSWKFGRCFRT